MDESHEYALASFTQHLLRTHRVLALAGAGLSASSGVPTFSGDGAVWNGHEARSLSSPRALAENPALVWHYYAQMKQKAMAAFPNRAHLALAEFARRHGEFHLISQNIDGLCERAHHPRHQLHLLHGSLFNLRCTACGYTETDNFNDFLRPGPAGSTQTPQGEQWELSIPRCPSCSPAAILRPGIVMYGEQLPLVTIDFLENWIAAGPVDLIIVIGASSSGYAMAELVDQARAQGARVAMVNSDEDAVLPSGLNEDDWFFVGDAAELVPEMLRVVIGDV